MTSLLLGDDVSKVLYRECKKTENEPKIEKKSMTAGFGF